jgi:N-acetylmuramoyl-L-alanine amidase
MKTAAAALLLMAALSTTGAASVQAAARQSNTGQGFGKQYVSLNNWARANEFTIRWIERDKTLQCSNPRARLVFNVDPRQDLRKAQINGVVVWLAFPLVLQNGNAFISQVDLEQTLAPVLSPPANRPGIKIKTVCLDPGHGGSDPGEVSGGNVEKKYTLLLAQEVRDQLTRAGLKVCMTRTTDATVKVQARPEIARQHNADLFVSMHFNCSEQARNEVKGVEVYCCTPAGATSRNAGGEGDTRWVKGNQYNEKNMLLAYQVQESILKSLAVEDRGVKRARFLVLSEAAMPAILIEGGFLSHPAEGRKIADPAYRRQMARAIVEGILNYQRIVKG